MNLTPLQLASVCGATLANATLYAPSLNSLSKIGDLTNKARVAMFLAQVAYESSHFNVVEENLSYSAQRLVAVWPLRFASITAATPYAHNPPALANRVYGGRLGNVVGTNDGWVFRGRGLIQLTGRANYARLGAKLSMDLINHPEQAADPATACRLAVQFWIDGSCNAMADAGNIHNCTLAINGGTNGLDERTELWHAVSANLSKLDPSTYTT